MYLHISWNVYSKNQASSISPQSSWPRQSKQQTCGSFTCDKKTKSDQKVHWSLCLYLSPFFLFFVKVQFDVSWTGIMILCNDKQTTICCWFFCFVFYFRGIWHCIVYLLCFSWVIRNSLLLHHFQAAGHLFKSQGSHCLIKKSLACSHLVAFIVSTSSGIVLSCVWKTQMHQNQ